MRDPFEIIARKSAQKDERRKRKRERDRERNKNLKELEMTAVSYISTRTYRMYLCTNCNANQSR